MCANIAEFFAQARYIGVDHALVASRDVIVPDFGENFGTGHIVIAVFKQKQKEGGTLSLSAAPAAALFSLSELSAPLSYP